MLKGLANFPRVEITLVVSLNIQKVCVVIWYSSRNLLCFSSTFSHTQFLMTSVVYSTIQIRGTKFQRSIAAEKERCV